jgi:hypothetical protein
VNVYLVALLEELDVVRLRHLERHGRKSLPCAAMSSKPKVKARASNVASDASCFRRLSALSDFSLYKY